LEAFETIQLANHDLAGSPRCLYRYVDHPVHEAVQRRILTTDKQTYFRVKIPVRIVLIETTHPGNIGAVARAMKTMGVRDLRLVAPKSFPDEAATARASGADDILDRATVTADLPSAIADCTYVVGASARSRGGRWPLIDPRTAAKEIVARLSDQQVAIVMGPEHSGLTNEHLARCNALVQIPTAPEYGSLNLAMAVQVLCYELRMAFLARTDSADSLVKPELRDAPPATAAEIEGFHAHLEELLTRTGFLHPDHPKQLKRKLRRLFMRAELDQNEINILRGALASLDTARDRHK
jgi:tRNA (cytidine32/uridine32-2'-O)-methyltransferase